MVAISEKHKAMIEEAVAHLIGRADDRRGLEAGDLLPRVSAAIQKYSLNDDETADRAQIREFIEAIRADDLCLIAACEKGDETAWSDLVQRYDSTVKSAAYNFCKNREDAEDLAGSIWAELYGLRVDSEGNKKSKLGYYSGRGSLAGWLRAVTNQLAIDQFRKMKRLVQVEEDREFDALAQDSSDNSDLRQFVSLSENPEEIFSQESAQKDLAFALKAAISELAAEDRLIMKLYYFDDLKLKDIGETLGFHEATASRKVVRVQTEIRKMVEKKLRDNHGWDDLELSRNLSETAEKLGINMERLFSVLIAAVLLQEVFRAGVL